ncbi:MAG: hypothetical protein GY866_07790, partial [Proteobacteria bacterium]|nr:hypothetical protein [Pseudomonadota bacterium]
MNRRSSMKRSILLLGTVLFLGTMAVSCSEVDENDLDTQNESIPRFHELKGPYLGQEPPGMKRELFAPGILSDGLFNGLIYFTAGGTEVYFSSGFERPIYVSMFFYSHMKEGRWVEPVEFPVERSVVSRPVLSPDGTKVFFISSKMEEKPEGESNPVRIYYMEKVHDDWTAPRKIDFGDAFPYSCGQTSV